MKKYNKIGIIGNGEPDNKYSFSRYISNLNFLIAVNGGTKNCYKSGVAPDLIIGDVDSLPEKILNFYKKKGVDILSFPVEKDKTDTELAIETALEFKPKEIYFLCMLGKRIDHMLCNIFIMEKIVKKDIKAVILDKNHRIELLNKNTRINGKIGDIVSFISLSEKSKGITLKGFKYNVINGSLLRNQSMGISNIIQTNNAVIYIKKGLVLMIQLIK
ncbi:thiamine diphosphokinase [Candidatus Desantisbacteria bacterium]|nr:thiamine diphosphokinase [Candidatus Desantisbacteria bacterium]